MEIKVAKKAKKKIDRREYTKADMKELRAHSKAKTPIAKIMKLTKRTEGSLRQKALKLADNGTTRTIRLLTPHSQLSRTPIDGSPHSAIITHQHQVSFVVPALSMSS
jgi:hypothetical protein